MEKLVTRAYNSFKTDNVRGVITKLSSTQRLEDEIGYYVSLETRHPEQSVFFPRILASSELGAENKWMDLELYDYPNLGSYLLGQNKMKSWERTFKQLNEILTSWSFTYPRTLWSEYDVKQAAYDMYITKTEREQQAFNDGWKSKLDCIFVHQIKNHTIILNKKEYMPFELIWGQIKNYIEANMLEFTPTLIHGDCCFSNILHSSRTNLFRFIDPRGSFGKVGIYGDIRYDVAKLYHSVDGLYEIFINDKFEVTSSGNVHTLKTGGLLTKINQLDILHEFENIFFPQFNKKQIKIIQGCIFIGMCARHYDNLKRQHAMYLTGVRLLNEALWL